jgi:signal transduction histidine kinase/ActR/RegA family two-component response regulator
MSERMVETIERRVLICAPLGKDAGLAREVLEGAGLFCCLCPSWFDLMRELNEGAGLILTVEEVLTPVVSVPFTTYLSAQPTWSDLPILVLTKGGGTSPWIHGAYECFGNLTLLERPVRAPTLISAARSALRARLRQYEIRLSDQRKDEFLAMLAHELRNPLAPISSAAQILKLVSAYPEKVKHTSEVIDRQVGHLTNLIDDLLDVARVTRGLIKLEKEPLDIRNLVSQAIEQVGPQISMKRQHLVVHFPDESTKVLGDSKRLIQVVANLLNNASKYTPVDGNISVVFELLPDQIILSITDNGIGIAPEMVPQVFDLFAQAERTSDRSQGGLGLGLALVKSLVTSHGGNVQAMSNGLGKGSTFIVRLPRLIRNCFSAKPELVTSSAKINEAIQPLSLMVVDDNKDAADALAMFLDTSGHKVFVEYTALGALECARLMSPQICILDIGLPDMDGNELARQLRIIPETAESIFIALTGYSQEQDRKKSFAAGFDHHFVKPVDVTTLINAITENKEQKKWKVEKA